MVLAPPETLKRRADFLRLASRGRKAARPGFVLQGLNGEAELRVGYTASRKIGNAVARNRARRRLKEAARLTIAALRRSGQGPSGELVLICRRETATVPFPLLCASLRSAILDLAK